MNKTDSREKKYSHLRRVLGEVHHEELKHQAYASLTRLGNLLSRFGEGLEERIAICGTKGKTVNMYHLRQGEHLRYYKRKGVLIGVTDDNHYIYFIPSKTTHVDRKDTVFLAVHRVNEHHPGGGWLYPAHTDVIFKGHMKISPEEVALNLNVARQLRTLVEYLKQSPKKREERPLPIYVEYGP